ncbi:hypothetical protein NO995_05290 [Aestuariibaculum sp. M13]|uniref:hypothetical protein n=1 Tax=Aestuariibaculum sp. M13 TaxID=2967132 RepID=UPI002159EDB0|nr:hypothetical protein [Aestuariibaculum sp. M13]MCR8667086.1 hypothetical protein [Aestuariibaculum sp. M13]
MVIVKDLKPISKDDGATFYCLIVEGSMEPVRSERTGRMYFTARRATVPTTLDEKACKAAIGTTFEGDVKKVPCDPYKYIIEDTGEEVELTHRWEFVDPATEIMDKHMVKDKQTIK